MPIDERASKNGQIVYDSGEGPWRRINANVWLAPNGDTVSVLSMSLELRIRLGTGEEFDAGPNREAVRQIKTILDR